jgi:hypothetical protein
VTRAKISEYSATAGDNTDVNGVNIAEGCPPSSMNNMGREIMAALKRFQVGSDGDGVTVGGALVVSGATTLTTVSATVVQSDTVSEKTSAAGVTIDSVLLKDNKVTANELTINSNNISADNSLGFRNRIINGDMRIDQRNAGAAVTLTAGGIYTVDRWQGVEDTDGGMTAQQDSSAPAGFVNSVKCTTTTADGTLTTTQNVQFRQAIEGLNVADLAWGTANAKTVTLSFWVRSSLTGTFGGSLRNSAVNRSYPFTYSISVADTWEQKSVTIEGDTSGTWLTTNGIGVTLTFGLGAGPDRSGTAGAWNSNNNTSATGAVSVIGTLNATWYVTGVQLEVGSVATPFERRPFGTELSLCQRYYQILKRMSAYVSNTNAVNWNLIYYCPMRVIPTLGQQGVIEINDNNVNAVQTSVGIVGFNGDSDGYIGQLQNFPSTLTVNRVALFRLSANTNGITVDAEL